MSAAVRSGFSIFALIFFLLNVWFLYAVDKLGKNGCKCAEGWRRSFIEFMLAVFVILFIVGLIFPIGTYMVGILLFVYFAFFVAYIIITRQFIDTMYSTDCTCAETAAIWWLGLINIIQIIWLIIAVILVLMALLFMTKGKYAKPSSRRR